MQVVLVPKHIIAKPGPAADANEIALVSSGWSWHTLPVLAELCFVALGKHGPFACRTEKLRMLFIFFLMVVPDDAASAVVLSLVSFDV